MRNLDKQADLPTLSMIMNRYSSLGSRNQSGGSGPGPGPGPGPGSEIQQFIKSLHPKQLKQIKNAIQQDNQQLALQLACDLVVEYFSYIPMKQCVYHGKFVYELLKITML